MDLREGRIRRRSSLGNSGTAVGGSFIENHNCIFANHDHTINEDIELRHAAVPFSELQMFPPKMHPGMIAPPRMNAPPSSNQPDGTLVNIGHDTKRHGCEYLDLQEHEQMDRIETLLELSFFDEFVAIFGHG